MHPESKSLPSAYAKLREAQERELHTDAPLHAWQHDGAFDSVKECEGQRVQLWKTYKADRLAVESGTVKRNEYSPWTAELGMLRARCITSDDPRLTKKER
jgi:hypothetical protein